MFGAGGADGVGDAVDGALGQVGAVEQGDEFVFAGVDVLQQFQGGFLQVVPGDDEFAVVQPDDVALLYLHAVNFHGAGGGGDFAGFHLLHGLAHPRGDLLQVAVGVKTEHGGQSLRDGAAGDDDHFLDGQLGGGLGGQDDVLVVGQDDDLVRGEAFDGVQDVFGAGVHRLPALDDGRGPQTGEDAGDARPRRDDHSGDLPRLHGGQLQFLSLPLFDFFHLRQEVLDGDFRHRAQGHGVVNRFVALFGGDVDVHPVDAVPLADLNGSAHLLQAGVEILQIQRSVGDEVHHHLVILPRLGALQGLLGLEGGQGLKVGFRLVEGLVPDVAQHPFQDEVQPLAARIHYAGLFEHRQQFRGAPDGFVGGLDDAGQDFPQVAGFFQGGLPRGGRVLADGQDGALHGADDAFVSRIAGLGQRLDEEFPVHPLRSVHGAGHAAPDLGENHAGVAARSHQRAVRQGAGHFSDVAVGHVLDFIVGRLHGEEHVRAGIAVGDGKDVQGVDNFVVGTQPGQTGLGQALEKASVQNQFVGGRGGGIGIYTHPVVTPVLRGKWGNWVIR